MKLSGHLILFILVVISSLLAAFLGVHVILSIASLYSLTFITQFSFAQIYGLWVVFGIFKYRHLESNKKDEDSPYLNAFNKVLTTALAYLISWGVAFLIFSFLN